MNQNGSEIWVMNDNQQLTERLSQDLSRSQVSHALVVDDDPGWTQILNEVLGDAGYSIRSCSGFGEALGCIMRTRFDLAVIDLVLNPIREENNITYEFEMDGARLVTKACAIGTPTIILSGMSSPELIEKMYREHNIFAFFEKQHFQRESFLRTIAELEKSRAYFEKIGSLTEREKEVFYLLGSQMSNQQIAKALIISPNTVKRHLQSVFTKMEIHNRDQAVAMVQKGQRNS
jgi:DNA-binding NarL/FixJ family response regulator